MEQSSPNLFHEYAEPVIRRVKSDEFASTFQACSELLYDRIQQLPTWQIALPVIACVAAGGTLEEGSVFAAAWLPGYLASEILDNIEDDEFIPDQWAISPEVAINLATGLIFLAFHALSSIRDHDRGSSTTRIFSETGFSAVYGQHRDLVKTQASVEKTLNDYWDMIIAKSGSVFRTATAGGAVAGTVDERVIAALGDYGTALGVMLQLLDDCRDIFTLSEEITDWEISLPLLLYLMINGEEKISFPKVSSKAELSDLFSRAGVIHVISSLLLEWKDQALGSLESLADTPERRLLESIPLIILERLNTSSVEVPDGSPS
jgi:hypothetical protein